MGCHVFHAIATWTGPIFLFLPQSASIGACGDEEHDVSNPADLYLTLDCSGDGGPHARETLLTAIAAAPVSTVLLTPGEDGRIDPALAKELTGLGQKKGVAMLIADDVALARSLKADGVHLTWSKDQVSRYRDARDHFGAHAIVGADAGRSRHDAMGLAEAGADYVAFGIPPHVEDVATARERQADLIAWWSEIFEVPCVAMDVASQDDAAAFYARGADFVAVSLPVSAAANDLIAFVQALAASKTTVGTPA